MSAINITLDTETRQVALIVDGVTIPNAEVFFSYFFFEGEDGEEKFVDFNYSTQTKDENGLETKQIFRLPPPEPEEDTMLLPNGLAAMTPEQEFNEKVKAWFNKRRS